MPTSSAHPLLLRIVDDLAGPGWSQQSIFLPPALTAELAAECRARADAGELTPAAIGRGGRQLVQEGVRGDYTAWLEPGQCAPGDAWLALMESLRQTLNRELFLGLEELECHFALYPPGAFYRRHFDRFRDDDSRTVTVVLYLNEAWQPDEGGELRLYLPGGRAHDMMPQGGSLACFMSASFPHEVLPATRERLSLTGWFRRRADNPLDTL
ncbi:2OG-Fe(II) oxygenase family [Azotobacter vinelandii CA]|uniref:2OG-Fe(II) oxygenase family n=2 Tax=Azotobacter vinelandii TaxID=354 RepID=C1DK35_AZOVD|nr:2OG-Fe(II) oxygenase [Azotobacter vinelandii]ACO80940.1 2OG-Fe(II) oxygenase family [Azotobacter vinelandii DJ]AGK15844.1 2OG-Fe(II) oxygenase family [Azotobacter vinelandii CA]AGK22248.1 2OG-Fe(II) oxygenase family [Azotobacter vinelandii CA6]WKN21732.1 2OG-Fe(II) oxygenase [Azotobacter vinelandii]SFW99733.1 SM-20-related protein [Azotobacter vinelandii]